MPRKPPKPAVATFQKIARNHKLVPVVAVKYRTRRPNFEPADRDRNRASSTWVSMAATCPSTCFFYGTGRGCYAGAGPDAHRLDRAARRTAALDVIREEVRLIDAVFHRGVPQDGGGKGRRGRGRDLRLHVAGDTSCTRGTRLLAAAARRWIEDRDGGAVWTYTHRWRRIPREAWGPINVLASVEQLHEIDEAAARGYAAAIVMHTVPVSRKVFRPPGSGFTLIPCPAQDYRKSCVECRACLDRDLLQRREAIVFATHGRDQEGVRARLTILQDAPELLRR